MSLERCVGTYSLVWSGVLGPIFQCGVVCWDPIVEYCAVCWDG